MRFDLRWRRLLWVTSLGISNKFQNYKLNMANHQIWCHYLARPNETQDHWVQVERNGGEKIRAREGQLEVKEKLCEWLWDPRSQQEVIANMGKGKATLTNYFIHSFFHSFIHKYLLGACCMPDILLSETRMMRETKWEGENEWGGITLHPPQQLGQSTYEYAFLSQTHNQPK